MITCGYLRTSGQQWNRDWHCCLMKLPELQFTCFLEFKKRWSAPVLLLILTVVTQSSFVERFCFLWKRVKQKLTLCSAYMCDLNIYIMEFMLKTVPFLARRRNFKRDTMHIHARSLCVVKTYRYMCMSFGLVNSRSQV